MPSSGNGNPGSVISAICSGNASMCGYVAGSSSLSRKPHTVLYAAKWAGSTTTPVRTSSVSGSESPDGLRSTPPSSAFGYSVARLGVLSSSRIATSGPQQGLAADADHVAVHRGRRRVRVPGDRLGDVDREAALAKAGQPPAGLADEQRDSRRHLRL